MSSEANYNAERLQALLIRARLDSGLGQRELADRCGFSQQQISGVESGTRRPTIELLLKTAQALNLPLQFFLTGRVELGRSLRETAIELHHWGMVDLWVDDALVPGTFRGVEEIINLVLSERCPDPRILEALPVLLAWNDVNPLFLAMYATNLGTERRLGWLVSLTLALSDPKPFPGGCHRSALQDYLATVQPPDPAIAWDDLGKASAQAPRFPLWKRWRINYDAKPSQFLERATAMLHLRNQLRRLPSQSRVNTGQKRQKARRREVIGEDGGTVGEAV